MALESAPLILTAALAGGGLAAILDFIRSRKKAPVEVAGARLENVDRALIIYERTIADYDQRFLALQGRLARSEQVGDELGTRLRASEREAEDLAVRLHSSQQHVAEMVVDCERARSQLEQSEHMLTLARETIAELRAEIIRIASE